RYRDHRHPHSFPTRRSSDLTTTRENVDAPLSRDHLVHFCPGIQGGVEWNGAAFSPDTNSLFVAAVDWCANVRLKRDVEVPPSGRSEEHTSELQSRSDLVCRL